MVGPICPYCGQPSNLVNGKIVYPHRHDLYDKQFWLCQPCVAFVGCYPHSTKPLGSLANAELRKERSKVHAAFDLIWKRGGTPRSKAYIWLANQLGLPVEECHIGMFDVQLCRSALTLLRT